MPPSKQTVKVDGLREFMRATARAEKDTKKMVRAALSEAASEVRDDAEHRFQPISPESASKFRVSVRQAGIFVVQSLRKTTGTRPDYGALQMRNALIPALQDNAEEVDKRVNEVTDELRDIVEGRRFG